jgi:hypothetical protein
METRQSAMIFNKLYDLFCFPSLIIHELWHIIAVYLVGGRLKSFRLHSLSKARLYVRGLNNISKVRIVAMVPFISLFISLLLPFLFGIEFLTASIYFHLTLRSTIPSYLDFEMAELTPPSFYTFIMGRSYQDYLDEKKMYELNFPEP